MPGAARLGDKAQGSADAHGCPGCPHPTTGPIIGGSANVNINGRPAARLQDPGMHAACCGTNTWKVSQGSETVFINGKPAARMGDQSQHCGGTGQLIEGSTNVIIGGAPTSGGSGGGAAGGGGGGRSSGGQGAGTVGGSGSGSGNGAGASSSSGAASTGGSGAAPTTDAAGNSDSAGSAGEYSSEKTRSLHIELVDHTGRPMAGQRFQATLPNGQVIEGVLNDEGHAILEDVPEGECKVRFPDLEAQETHKR